ncbi:MAG: small multi-drug export protein [Clostridiales bacterium]|nr:small multi-drug export protein [Clostridiales bacterium]MBR5975652.1 small multi-drug export protein [Clostridiales bacterium]
MIKNAIYVFLISMIPVVELRGSIPVGCSRGLPWYIVFAVAVIGNLLPVPFILLFVRKVFDWMRKYPKLKKIVDFCENKFAKKVEKAGNTAFWTLVGFIAIPLPGTGAWTGSGIAAVCEVPFKKALLAAIIGVLIAATVVTMISYGVLAGLSFLL